MRPFRAALRGALPLALVLPIAVGCSSLPSDVGAASHLKVTYYDFRTDSELSIGDEADPQFENLYSRPSDNATVKLVPDELLRDFVSFAAGEGFFDHARPLSGPDPSMRQNAFRMILVEADGRGQAFVLERGLGQADRDAVQAFNDIQIAFVQFYNSIPQLQYIGTSAGGGADYFQKEQERVRRENQESMKGGGQ